VYRGRVGARCGRVGWAMSLSRLPHRISPLNFSSYFLKAVKKNKLSSA
jgi:hypothetical protein